MTFNFEFAEIESDSSLDELYSEKNYCLNYKFLNNSFLSKFTASFNSGEFTVLWLNDILKLLIKNLIPDIEISKTDNFINDFGRDDVSNFISYFGRDDGRDYVRDFCRDYVCDYVRYFVRYFSRDFINDFGRDYVKNFFCEFGRDFVHNFDRDFVCAFVHYFIHDFVHDLSYYNRRVEEILNIKIKNNEHFEELIIESFSNKNLRIIELLYPEILNYIFIFKISANLKGNYNYSFVEPKIKSKIELSQFLINSAAVIPLIPHFIFFEISFRYFLTYNAYLNVYYSKYTNVEEKFKIEEKRDYFERTYPFSLNLLSLSWDYISKNFRSKYIDCPQTSETATHIAAYIISAAKIAVISGKPMQGGNWNAILDFVNASDDLFIKTALTVYRMSCFEEVKKNTEILDERLIDLKKQYPEIYCLIFN